MSCSHLALRREILTQDTQVTLEYSVLQGQSLSQGRHCRILLAGAPARIHRQNVELMATAAGTVGEGSSLQGVGWGFQFSSSPDRALWTLTDLTLSGTWSTAPPGLRAAHIPGIYL